MRAGFTSRQAFVLITLAEHCSLPLACWQNILILSRSGHAGALFASILPLWILHQACLKVARFIKRVKRRLRRNRGGTPI